MIYSLPFSGLFAIIRELPRSIDGSGRGMWLTVIDNASTYVRMTSKIVTVCGETPLALHGKP